MRCRASARICATTTRRASWRGSRTPRPSTRNRTGCKLVGEVLKYAIARKGILSLNPDADLRVLEIRRAGRQLRPAAHLHAGELQGRRAVDPRRFPGHDHRLLAAAARQHRLRPRALGRSVRASRHPAQLPRRRKRPPRAAGRHEARPPPARLAAAQQILRPRGVPRPAGAVRRRASGRRQAARHHHLPSHGHLPHGAGQRSDRGGRRPAARARASRACAWSTPRSCRPCRRPISTPRC